MKQLLELVSLGLQHRLALLQSLYKLNHSQACSSLPKSSPFSRWSTLPKLIDHQRSSIVIAIDGNCQHPIWHSPVEPHSTPLVFRVRPRRLHVGDDGGLRSITIRLRSSSALLHRHGILSIIGVEMSPRLSSAGRQGARTAVSYGRGHHLRQD